VSKAKKIFCAAAIAFVGLSSIAQADTLSDIKQRKKVLVGIDLTFAPFGYMNESMTPAGSDVSAARMLAKDLGVDLEIVQLTGPNRVPYLLTKKVDMVISSFSITPERKKVIDFSVPYSVSESVILGPKSIDVTKLQDLAGKRVGLVRGNLQDTLLKPIAPEGMQPVRFDDDASNVVALLSGQVDLLAGSKELLPNIMKQRPQKQIEVKLSIAVLPHGIGIRKEDGTLLAWTDNWVVTNLKNGRLSTSYKEAVGFPLPDMSQFMPK
jgi:polar amino acid transport system substrate-binding protein